MRKPVVAQLPIIPYGGKVEIVIAKNLKEAWESVSKLMRKQFREAAERTDLTGDDGTGAVTLTDGWLHLILATGKTDQVGLSHELLHVTHHVLDHRNIPYGDLINDETVTYLHDWLIRETLPLHKYLSPAKRPNKLLKIKK